MYFNPSGQPFHLERNQFGAASCRRVCNSHWMQRIVYQNAARSYTESSARATAPATGRDDFSGVHVVHIQRVRSTVHISESIWPSSWPSVRGSHREEADAAAT